jgi:Family of unknown function (DUF6788)
MITTQQLSNYRKEIRRLLKQIEALAFCCTSTEELRRGTPNEVFRTCGKKACRCKTDPKKRHGPYRVVQILKDGKKKQVALTTDQRNIWTSVKAYQEQRNNLLALQRINKQLSELIRNILEQRTQELM